MDVIFVAEQTIKNHFIWKKYHPFEWIEAYDANGQTIPGFPITVNSLDITSTNNYSHQHPLVGDIDKDGYFDMTYISSDSTLVFKRFPNARYVDRLAPAPMWRYDRGFTNCAPIFGDPICGDCNAIDSVTYDDFTYLVNYSFSFGPQPIPLSTGDLNCDNDINIADVVYMLGFVEGDSLVKFACDTACTGSSPKPAQDLNEIIQIFSEIKDGRTIIKLNSQVDLKALQFDLLGNNSSNIVKLMESEIDMHIGISDEIIRISFIDLEGENKIDTGEFEIVSLYGEHILSNINGVSSDTVAFYLNPLKGSPYILPEKFALSQNYPNPFNPTTTINFSLPKPSNVTIDIYNILGQKVTVLLNENFQAGNHSIQWDGRDNNNNEVASGVYFYRLSTDSFIESKKMMLLK